MNIDDVAQRLKERAAKTIISTMNLKQRPNLNSLSEKKRVAMDCFVDAIERIDNLPMDIKRDWITWVFYTQKFLNDEQTDQFIKALLISGKDYEFAFFVNELNQTARSKLIQAHREVTPQIALTIQAENFLM